MGFEAILPKEYSQKEWKMKPFLEGFPTERISNSLENVLYLYSRIAKGHAKSTNNAPKNYKIKEVYLVGSGARENRVDSDLDFLLVAPRLDEVSSNFLKSDISNFLFCDRPKQEAVDVFINREEVHPGRESFNLTDFYMELLKKYNKKLR